MQQHYMRSGLLRQWSVDTWAPGQHGSVPPWDAVPTSSRRAAAGSRNLRTVRLLAHVVLVGYHGLAMLSRAQEARVQAILWSNSAGTIHTYCLEHLATAAKIPPGHLPDHAVFVRTLHERGDCQRRFGGFCDADRHETKQTLVWGPPTRLVAQGLT